MRKLNLFLAGLVVCLSLIPPVGIAANRPTLIKISQEGTKDTNQEAMKTFTGKVMKQGDLYILTDKSSKTNYQLDDPQKVREYEGKEVKVTGTLDAENLTIHVQTIVEIS